MGWVSIGGSSSSSDSTRNESQYGTRTPTLSDDWTTAYNNLAANTQASGANAVQTPALTWLSNNLAANPVGAAATTANNALGFANSQMNGANNYWKAWADQGAYTLNNLANQYGGAYTPPQDVTTTPIAAPTIDAKTGASLMGAYKNPYDTDVVNASLNDYDVGTDCSANALRAARDAGSAFGERSGIADAVFQGEADRGRGALSANLRQQGFNTAAGLGMQDANRILTADQTNAANRLAADQFNSGQSLGAQQFNNTMLNNRQQFDVGAAYQADQERANAVQNLQNNLATQTGLSQQQLQNVVTANGVNTQAAQALMAAGAITQSQLDDILNAAAQTNGYSWAQNTNETGHQTGSSSKFEFGPSLDDLQGPS